MSAYVVFLVEAVVCDDAPHASLLVVVVVVVLVLVARRIVQHAPLVDRLDLLVRILVEHFRFLFSLLLWSLI